MKDIYSELYHLDKELFRLQRDKAPIPTAPITESPKTTENKIIAEVQRDYKAAIRLASRLFGL